MSLLKSRVFFAACLAAAGAMVLGCQGGGAYGVSKMEPLGTYDRLDSHLAGKMGLMKADDADISYSMSADGVIEHYVDKHGREEQSMVDEVVSLTVNDEGRITGFGAQFHYNHNTLSFPSPLGRFAYHFWEVATGSKPRYAAGNIATLEGPVLSGTCQVFPSASWGKMSLRAVLPSRDGGGQEEAQDEESDADY